MSDWSSDVCSSDLAYVEEGFEWIDPDDADQSVISFVRKGDDPKNDLVVVINFDVNPHEDFKLGLPREGYWVETFNSDSGEFGGSGVTNEGMRFASKEEPWNNRDQSIELRLPPLAGLILRYDGPLPPKKKVAADSKKDERAPALRSLFRPASTRPCNRSGIGCVRQAPPR